MTDDFIDRHEEDSKMIAGLSDIIKDPEVARQAFYRVHAYAEVNVHRDLVEELKIHTRTIDHYVREEAEKDKRIVCLENALAHALSIVERQNARIAAFEATQINKIAEDMRKYGLGLMQVGEGGQMNHLSPHDFYKGGK